LDACARGASSEHATGTSDDDDDDDDSSSPVCVLLATCVHARWPPETEVFPRYTAPGTLLYRRTAAAYRTYGYASRKTFTGIGVVCVVYRYDARIVSSRG